MVINTLQANDDKFTAKETMEMKLKLFSTACFSLILITACSPTPSEKTATEGVKNEAVVAKENELVHASHQHEHEEKREHTAHQHDEEHEEKHEHTAHQHDEEHEEKHEHTAHQHDEEHEEKEHTAHQHDEEHEEKREHGA